MKKLKLVISLVTLPIAVSFAQGKVDTTANSKAPIHKVAAEGEGAAKPKEKKKADGKDDINNPPKKNTLASTEGAGKKEGVYRKYEYKGKKFEKVPLVGDLDYFGTNHATMLTYTQKYLSSRNRTFAAVAQRDKQGKIFAMMDKIFDKHDIPHEMKYLAVIESALNKNALSPVGAYGPWQFMPGTGLHMGLTVTANRDDRADWSRSTHAACKYMTYLYNMFDDWLLVVAAYNSGPRPVLNAIKKTGKNDFWSIKKYLYKETQNHVMAFIATATVFEYIPEYAATGVPANFDWASLNRKVPGMNNSGIADVKKPKNPLAERFSKNELAKMSMVKIKEPVDMDFLASFLQHDRSVLERWNYDYIDFLLNFKPGDVYVLKLPKEKMDAFLQNKGHIMQMSRKKLN